MRNELVWCREDGTPVPKDTIEYAWRRVLRKAGIRHVRIHDMRHTYASRLVQNGAPLQAVSRLLGHSDIRTTMRYAHLSQHNLEAAAALFDAPDGDEVVTSATG